MLPLYFLLTSSQGIPISKCCSDYEEEEPKWTAIARFIAFIAKIFPADEEIKFTNDSFMYFTRRICLGSNSLFYVSLFAKDKPGLELSDKTAYLAYIIGKVFSRMLERSYASFEEVVQQREKNSTYQDTIEDDEDGDYDGISVEMRAHPAMVAALAVFQDVFIRPILLHEDVTVFLPKIVGSVRGFLVDYWGPSDDRLQRHDRQHLYIYHLKDGFFSCITSKSLRETLSSRQEDSSTHGSGNNNNTNSNSNNNNNKSSASSSAGSSSRQKSPSRLSPEWEAMARSYMRICSNVSQDQFESSFTSSAGIARIVCATTADPFSTTQLQGDHIGLSSSSLPRNSECILFACIHRARDLLVAISIDVSLINSSESSFTLSSAQDFLTGGGIQPQIYKVFDVSSLPLRFADVIRGALAKLQVAFVGSKSQANTVESVVSTDDMGTTASPLCNPDFYEDILYGESSESASSTAAAVDDHNFSHAAASSASNDGNDFATELNPPARPRPEGSSPRKGQQGRPLISALNTSPTRRLQPPPRHHSSQSSASAGGSSTTPGTVSASVLVSSPTTVGVPCAVTSVSAVAVAVAPVTHGAHTQIAWGDKDTSTKTTTVKTETKTNKRAKMPAKNIATDKKDAFVSVSKEEAAPAAAGEGDNKRIGNDENNFIADSKDQQQHRTIRDDDTFGSDVKNDYKDDADDGNNEDTQSSVKVPRITTKGKADAAAAAAVAAASHKADDSDAAADDEDDVGDTKNNNIEPEVVSSSSSLHAEAKGGEVEGGGGGGVEEVVSRNLSEYTIPTAATATAADLGYDSDTDAALAKEEVVNGGAEKSTPSPTSPPLLSSELAQEKVEGRSMEEVGTDIIFSPKDGQQQDQKEEEQEDDDGSPHSSHQSQSKNKISKESRSKGLNAMNTTTTPSTTAEEKHQPKTKKNTTMKRERDHGQRKEQHSSTEEEEQEPPENHQEEDEKKEEDEEGEKQDEEKKDSYSKDVDDTTDDHSSSAAAAPKDKEDDGAVDGVVEIGEDGKGKKEESRVPSPSSSPPVVVPHHRRRASGKDEK